MDEPRIYRATLPHPVGINATYRVSANGGLHKSRRAKDSACEIRLALYHAGWHPLPLPAGNYWLGLVFHLDTCRLDCDAYLKGVIDLICEKIGVDDRCVGFVTSTKRWVRKTAQQQLRVTATIYPVTDKAEFTHMSNNAVRLCLLSAH